MALDTDRIDEAVLALLYLGLHDQYRAWKGFDWDAMSRLHEKGMIENPVNKAKSVVFTTDGLLRSRELFDKMFSSPEGRCARCNPLFDLAYARMACSSRHAVAPFGLMQPMACLHDRVAQLDVFRQIRLFGNLPRRTPSCDSRPDFVQP
jgi:hypothetical protein